MGVPGLIPPLAQWSDMIDGTYGLMDVQDMHAVMDEVVHQREQSNGE